MWNLELFGSVASIQFLPNSSITCMYPISSFSCRHALNTQAKLSSTYKNTQIKILYDKLYWILTYRNSLSGPSGSNIVLLFSNLWQFLPVKPYLLCRWQEFAFTHCSAITGSVVSTALYIAFTIPKMIWSTGGGQSITVFRLGDPHNKGFWTQL